MIIILLLDLVYALFDRILGSGTHSPIPLTAFEVLNTAFEYMGTGAKVLSNYVDLPYLMSLFLIILSVDSSIILYRSLMWILKKIPLLNIK